MLGTKSNSELGRTNQTKLDTVTHPHSTRNIQTHKLNKKSYTKGTLKHTGTDRLQAVTFAFSFKWG